jgi:hypothetical protein
MSALPPKADMCGENRHVCFGPVADMPPYSRTSTGLLTSRSNFPQELRQLRHVGRDPPGIHSFTALALCRGI